MAGTYGLNQTSRDWHTRVVTLNPSAEPVLSIVEGLRITSVKGLAVRFFAALRMTWPGGRVGKCTKVMPFGLAKEDFLPFQHDRVYCVHCVYCVFALIASIASIASLR
jgi:hypothetical protein